MFGNVLEKVQELFSASFLLGYLLPVVMIVGVNVLIASLGLGNVPSFTTTFDNVLGGTGGELAFILLAMIVLAYVLAPLIPVFRAILEGRLSPLWVRRHGERRWRAVKEKLKSEMTAAKDRFTALESRQGGILAKLRKARQAGDNLVIYLPGYPHDHQAIARAQAAINALEVEMGAQGEPAEAKLAAAIDALAAALKGNRVKDASDPSSARQDIVPRLRDLDKLHERMRNDLADMTELARLHAAELSYRFRSQFGLRIEPTKLGNARAAMERYPAIAYGVEFDFLWPRLQSVLAEDTSKAIKTGVDAATVKRDSAVLLTVLSAVTVLVWLPVLAMRGLSFPVFVAVGVLGPLAVLFFYNLVAETEKAFGEVLAATVDALRLQLLIELKQPTPDTLGAERKIWDTLQRALYAQGGVDFRYRP